MEIINKQDIQKIGEHYAKLLGMKNPMERMEAQLEYLKTHTITTDAILFLTMEMELMWKLHKHLFEEKDESSKEIPKSSG